MPKADLSLTTFGNNPVAEKLVPDIYDEEAVSNFLKNATADTLVSLKKVFPDIPSDALTLGPSKGLLGFDIGAKDWTEKLKKLGEGANNLLDLIRTVMSNMPPLAKADQLLSMFDLPTLAEGLKSIRKWLDPKTWTTITNDFISSVFGYVADISGALGTSCSFCRSFCGEIANRYSDLSYPEGEIWKAAFLLYDLKELFRCKLLDVALGAIDAYTGGIVSSGTAGRVLATAAKIAAIYQEVDKAVDFIERAGSSFTEKDREETLVSLAEGYEIDPKLNVEQYDEEAVRVADDMTRISPSWFYLWTEGGNHLTTKYLYRTSDDFVKILAFHPEYWPLGIIEESFDPLTRDWKELAVEDNPVLYFVE